MMDEIKRLDEEIYNIAFDIEKNSLNYINPINSVKQKEIFFYELDKHKFYEPNFKYAVQEKGLFEKNSRQLSEIIKELKNSPAEKILKTKSLNLLAQIQLLTNINSKKFCNYSKASYKKPNKKLVKIALERINDTVVEEERNISAQKACELFKTKLEKFKTGFTVTVEENMSAKAAEHTAEKKIKLNKNAFFSEKEIERLFVHEVETHVYRYLNGANQPIKCLSLGEGGEFIRTEEGLAVFNEKKAKLSSQSNVRQYLGRVIAVDYALKHDFFETFDYLTNYFQKQDAYTITQRVKRGVQVGEKGAFTKDYSYFAGLIEIEEFVNKGNEVKDLFLGKISIKEMKIVKKIPNIREAKYLPSSYH